MTNAQRDEFAREAAVLVARKHPEYNPQDIAAAISTPQKTRSVDFVLSALYEAALRGTGSAIIESRASAGRKAA